MAAALAAASLSLVSAILINLSTAWCCCFSGCGLWAPEGVHPQLQCRLWRLWCWGRLLAGLEGRPLAPGLGSEPRCHWPMLARWRLLWGVGSPASDKLRRSSQAAACLGGVVQPALVGHCRAHPAVFRPVRNWQLSSTAGTWRSHWPASTSLAMCWPLTLVLWRLDGVPVVPWSGQMEPACASRPFSMRDCRLQRAEPPLPQRIAGCCVWLGRKPAEP